MKKLVISAIFAATAAAGVNNAIAGDDGFGLSPEACEESVAYFLEDRLYNSTSARIELDGDPYRVMVSLQSGDMEAWAQDIRVKSRLPGGSWSSYQAHTVIFKDTRPIALDVDVSSFSPI